MTEHDESESPRAEELPPTSPSLIAVAYALGDRVLTIIHFFLCPPLPCILQYRRSDS